MSASAEIGLFLDGMHCSGCVNRVERALRVVPGVEEAAVNYTTHRALVRFDPECTAVEALVGEVTNLGFGATPYDPEALDRPHQRTARQALARLLVAAFLAGNVMLVAVALYIGDIEGMEATTRSALRWLAIALSAPAVVWCAAPFWRGAWKGLRAGGVPMDIPIVLGIAAAFSANVVGTVAGSDHLYVDSAAMIVFLVLLGRTLERRARSRASAAVDRLAALTPATALRCITGEDGTQRIERVEPAALVAGDRVIVAPGEAVPADGRVVIGETEVDESLLSGESVPVLRRVGDEVTGGTHNVLAEIVVEIERGIDRGTLARMSSLLERAQAERPRIQRSADRVAAVFAPSVIVIATITAIGWALSGAPWLEVVLAASAVLIVACPCALGLATPAAVTAAVGRAASMGILVKSGEALERCAHVDVAVLDKTGTLTRGDFGAVEARVLCEEAGFDEQALLRAAVRAEGSSVHPIAHALRAELEARAGKIPDECGEERRTVAGRGVIARFEAEANRAEGEASTWYVGSPALLVDAGIAVPAMASDRASFAEQGRTLVWVARDDRVLGVIALEDELRPDAAESIERLRALGVSPALISGDHRDAVQLAARRAGVDAFSWSIGPEEKVEAIRTLRAAGSTVVMAGDGINDAAALAASDVGVAMGGGSDVALHAAELAIRAGRLGALPDVIELSRAMLSRIRENLGFAVLYNAVAIPLAVGGWLSPLYAALAMSLSSVVVTANAVRLLRFEASSSGVPAVPRISDPASA